MLSFMFLLGFFTDPASLDSQNTALWEVRPVSDTAVFLNTDGQIETVVEASAVEPLGTGSQILVAHDKDATLRVYDLESGKPKSAKLGTDAFPSGLELGPKWEGLAQDQDSHFYVVGSHSGKNDDERNQRAFLLRFELVGDGSEAHPWAIKPGSVRRWNIADSVRQCLEQEKLPADRVALRKIEGLAIREIRDSAGKLLNRHLAIGLREPDDLVRVYETDITQTPENEASLTLKRAFAFAAGKSVDGQENLQLTSLERINSGPRTGYFVVTASEDKSNGFHGNRLWFIADQEIANATAQSPVAPELLWTFESLQKAEGLAILPHTTADEVSAVVVYDNDAKKTKTPSRFQRLNLRYRPATR